VKRLYNLWGMSGLEEVSLISPKWPLKSQTHRLKMKRYQLV
jgi:hypothetical protein